MELSKILKGIKLRTATRDTDIKKIAYNSNECDESSLFVAIKGSCLDGHDFAKKAYENGARTFILERPLPLGRDVQVVSVSDSRRALSTVAANFYENPSKSMKVFGVVGTNGKTTTTYILESILNEAGLSTGVIGTINYRYADRVIPAVNTTPESLDLQRMMYAMKKKSTKAVVIEVSSHALHQGRTQRVYFDAGIFTNLTQDHLDYHLNMRNYFFSKRRFFSRSLKQSSRYKDVFAAVNVDDRYGKKLFDEFKGTYALIPYSMKKCAGVYLNSVESSVSGSRLSIHTPSGDIRINTQLTGEFNTYNILGAVSLSLKEGISPVLIKRGVERVKNIPGRMQKVNTESGTVFVDYAHTPDALLRVIESVRELGVKRLITVFGCGGDRDKKKRRLMGEISRDKSDISIVTSDNPRSEEPLDIINEIIRPFNGSAIKELGDDPDDRTGYMYQVDREAAIEKAITMMGAGDAVIIAGKGHEDYQIIKDKKLPFDDMRIVKKKLKKIGLKIIE